MLEALFNNSKILGLATGRLKKIFTEDGITAIVIKHDETVTDGPLPGFKLDMYRDGVVVLKETDYNRLAEEMTARPHMITNAEMAEYNTLKNLQNAHGKLQAGATREQLGFSTLNGGKPDPAY